MADTTIDELQIKISAEATAAASQIKNFANSLRSSAGVMSDAANRLREISSSTSRAKEETEELPETSTKASAAIKRIGDYAKAAGAKVLSFGKNIASSLGKSAIESVKNITGKFGSLFASIKRIAFYRLIRSAIKGVTSAIKEGLQILIEWDRLYGNNTSFAARTADEISAKWTEVKKSFGAAAMPLIQIVQPALMTVMNIAIAVANAINQIFRTIQGYSTYMKATTVSIGNAADKLGGSAKELRRVLFGFDDLNVLPSDNPGGGGAAESNAGQLDFVETDIANQFKGSLSTIINNLVESINPYALGKSISEKINKGIGSVNNFLKEVNFKKIGQKIGSLLSSVLNNIDWNGLGQIIVRRVTAVPSIIIGAIQRINLGSLGTAIFQFLKGALDTAIEWIRGIDWYKTIYDFTSQIGTLIINLNPIELIGKILKFTLTVVVAVLKGLAGAFLGILKSTFDLAGSVIKWLKDNFDTIKKWLYSYVVAPIQEIFKALGQTIDFMIDYVIHPSKWGTDFIGGIREIWNGAILELEAKQAEAQGVLNQNPLVLRATLSGLTVADVNSKLTTLQGIIDKSSGLKIPYTLESWNNNLTSKYSQQPYYLPDPRKAVGITGFADGGIIPNGVGSLFVAGERGAEVVANLGHSTGVMNVDQMQEAVAEGNAPVVEALYAVLRAIQSKDSNVYLDGKKIGQSVSRYQQNQARRGVAY